LLKNGKLFGKINIIDFSIIIVLLVAVAFVVYKTGVLSPKKAVAASGEKIRVVLYQEEIPTYVPNNVKIGDPITEKLANVSFGNVTDISTAASVSWGKNSDGVQVKSTKEGYSSVTLTTETIGSINSNGFTIGGTKYNVGQLLVFYVGTSIFYCRIAEVSLL
jgi:predicted DNA-binding antitoxin AbrB/MazE fold protein